MEEFMENVTIIFKKPHIEFLSKNIRNEKLRSKFSQEFKKNILERNYSVDRYPIELTDREIEIVLDELSFLITSIGINEKGDINKEGIFIENIVDLLVI